MPRFDIRGEQARAHREHLHPGSEEKAALTFFPGVRQYPIPQPRSRQHDGDVESVQLLCLGVEEILNASR